MSATEERRMNTNASRRVIRFIAVSLLGDLRDRSRTGSSGPAAARSRTLCSIQAVYHGSSGTASSKRGKPPVF
jgi:hypothetical protein